MKHYKSILIAILIVIFLGLTVPYWSEMLIGARPEKEFKPTPVSKGNAVASKDGETLKLIKAVENDPENIDLKRQLIAKLEALYLQSGDVALQMDEVDQLSQILKKIPDDAEANFKLAEISFNAQVFDKAVERYQIYLGRKPEDSYARLRLASAKIFTAQFASAIADLDLVLSIEPANFSALAYKSIALAQTGDLDGARKFGEQAYNAAPDNEGKERFKRFLDSLDTKPEVVTAASDWQSSLAENIRSNPVAGTKFIRLELIDSVLKLYFKDFPAENMPPFARDKFLAGIRQKTDKQSVKSIQLVDEPSKRVMLTAEN